MVSCTFISENVAAFTIGCEVKTQMLPTNEQKPDCALEA